MVASALVIVGAAPGCAASRTSPPGTAAIAADGDVASPDAALGLPRAPDGAPVAALAPDAAAPPLAPDARLAAPAAAPQPRPTVPFWDGDDHAGGHAHVISGTFGAFAPSDADAAAGTTSLRLTWRAPGVGNSYVGWVIDRAVDVSARTKLVFWIKTVAEPNRPTDLFVMLRSVGAGGEHQREAGIGHLLPAPSRAAPNTGLVASGFNDGAWHRVEIPIARLCANQEHDTPVPYPCNGFDPRQVNELVLGKFSSSPEGFSVFVDELGFD